MNDLFINKWHLVQDIFPPENEDILFAFDEDTCTCEIERPLRVLVGRYNDEIHSIELADGFTVKIECVKQWKYVSSFEVVGYPRDCENVVAQLKGLDILVMGTYSCRYIDPLTGYYTKMLVVDDYYSFSNSTPADIMAVDWSNVTKWSSVPEVTYLRPLESIDVCNAEIEDPCEDYSKGVVETTPEEVEEKGNSAILRARKVEKKHPRKHRI